MLSLKLSIHMGNITMATANLKSHTDMLSYHHNCQLHWLVI